MYCMQLINAERKKKNLTRTGAWHGKTFAIQRLLHSHTMHLTETNKHKKISLNIPRGDIADSPAKVSNYNTPAAGVVAYCPWSVPAERQKTMTGAQLSRQPPVLLV